MWSKLFTSFSNFINPINHNLYLKKQHIMIYHSNFDQFSVATNVEAKNLKLQYCSHVVIGPLKDMS